VKRHFRVAKNKRPEIYTRRVVTVSSGCDAAGDFATTFDVVKIPAPLHTVDEQGKSPQEELKQIFGKHGPKKGGGGPRARQTLLQISGRRDAYAQTDDSRSETIPAGMGGKPEERPEGAVA